MRLTCIYTHTLKESKVVIHRRGKERLPVLVPVQKTVQIYEGLASYQTMMSTVTAPVWDSLRSIAQPVLIFNGDKPDCAIDWGHRYVTILPNARLHTIPGACHDPWLSNPNVFFTQCRRFIRQVCQKERTRKRNR